ncbi:MAG: histidine--tRNA ligase [Pseudomonadota bacterium]
MKSIQSVRGFRDLLPPNTATWRWLEQVVTDTLITYGYQEIRLPLLERTELFARSVGEHTDIVEKEMYTFPDRDGDQLSLRPEGTAGCVRAGIQNGLLHNQRQRLWYHGPMFRHERPQRGRYRQFHQIGAETFGFPGPDIDAELLILTQRIWQRLGLKGLRLEINSLGTVASRAAYRDVLVEYFSAHRERLDEDSQRRLGTNPLRILDSKNPQMAEVVAAAPQLTEHLDSESVDHFDELKALLERVGIEYAVNPRLVRGLDYYTRTAFEWLTDQLGAQAAVCAGGRYDGLVEVIGGRATPAVGWAMGLERVAELIELGAHEAPALAPQVYAVAVGEGTAQPMLRLAETLRDQLPELRLVQHCGGGGFKAQLKAADRSGAAYALIMGEQELERDEVALKPLREGGGEQRSVATAALVDALRETIE